MTGAPRLGLTLPSFRPGPEPVLAVAAAAERAGLDAVFAFDHLFRDRGSGGEPRPALELLTTMAAVMAATGRITVGSLVARASLRPPASLAAGLDTLARIGPGRLVAGLGSGDEESVRENEAFGVEPSDPIAGLREALGATRGRGYPVWVGGASPAVARLAAAGADGWNLWGGSPARFGRRVAETRREVERVGRDPDVFTCSWGGLCVVGAGDAEAEAKYNRLAPGRTDVLWGGPERVAAAVAAYGAGGAAWVILGPVDSSDPDNAAVLGEVARLGRAPELTGPGG